MMDETRKSMMTPDNSCGREPTAEETIEHLFTFHPPHGDQPLRYDMIRSAAKAFALVVHKCCPASADRTDAVRKIGEAVMAANASIARNGVSYR